MTLGLPDQPDMGAFDLKSLAAGALAVTVPDPPPGLGPAPPPEAVNAGPTPPVTEDDVMKEAPPHPPPAPLEIATRRIEPAQDGRPVQPAVPSPYSPRSFYSPRDSGSTPVPLKMDLTLSASGLSPSSHGEGLAPIQLNSPRSDTNGQTPLPSLTAALGDINQLKSSYHAEKERMRNPHPAFPHSPPGLPRLPSMHSHHASPPISPAETFRRDPLSPNHSLTSSVTSPRHGFYPQPNGHQPYDYPSSSAEPPTSDPSTATISERMSIEGLTSQSGSYVCKFDGCTAPPFQTQYLLNSHANVHSSARPHYCPVHGCTRSEGGKGFKRKNEMIRHGLVHDSPGYVCPFCPDREHKYPRPDNLQRYAQTEAPSFPRLRIVIQCTASSGHPDPRV
ncbi:hypothetical protein B0T24DRAFT_611977 [Lasiosphaeria ovina]|uniref:C2H2 type zinc finger domain-containing protein n=1 Tax=Lasiosphaeria ovina TaxID=92902 RepID=A0AAE0KNG5_9PEZI|nr:hypothetical protein B0T24DRAFT_611977 [Lasiosphaeria ovina]